MSAGEVKRPYGLLLELVTRNFFFFLIICDIFNKQMWSHGVSHKSFARLIYRTKCCRGVFLAQGVVAWRKRGRTSACKASRRHRRVSRDRPLIPALLLFLCRTGIPGPALERMLSPCLFCRVSALFLAVLSTWASLHWPGLLLMPQQVSFLKACVPLLAWFLPWFSLQLLIGSPEAFFLSFHDSLTVPG